MSVVRADFFLDARQRLTEQERALMTAMLSDLVTVVAEEISANLAHPPAKKEPAVSILEQLTECGMLDIPPLISVLLRRAEEERIASVIRVRPNGDSRRFLHRLAADPVADVAAAAMALILGRSRRRDRFDCARVDLDDVPAEAAVPLVYAVAAALQSRSGAPERSVGDAAAKLLAHHDEGKRLEALRFGLIHALDGAGRLEEDTIKAALCDGEAALAVEALARAAGVDFETAWAQTAAGYADFARLLRLAGMSRQSAAELLAGLGDLLAGGPAEAILAFDALSDEDVAGTRAWLRLHPDYRGALTLLRKPNGHAAD